MPKKQIEKIDVGRLEFQYMNTKNLELPFAVMNALIKKQDEIIDHINSQEEEIVVIQGEPLR